MIAVSEETAAMVIAEMIVEAHVNTWGTVPNPQYLERTIAANLCKAARLGSCKGWPIE